MASHADNSQARRTDGESPTVAESSLSRRRLVQTAAAASALAGSATLAASVPSASAQSSIETVIIALGADSRVLDPDLDQGLNDMYRLIFNSPITMSDAGEPQPDIAESWEYLDDTTLQMTLRKDVVWHDGEPLDSDDFLFTWERMKSPERESTNYPAFSPWLADVIAVDPYTVQFITSEPYAPAFDSLDSFWIAPRHYIEELGDDEFGLNPIGTGPYRVAEWQKDQFLDLEAADTWWGETAQPFPGVRFVIIPDTFTRAASLLSGDVHVVAEPPVSMIPQIESSGSAYIASAPGLRIQFIQFPHAGTRHADTPEIENKLVRQALNYALDRETIASAVGQNYFEVVPGPWPRSSWAYPENAQEVGYTYNPERARELLAEAGYADGFTLYFGTSNGFSLMDNELMQACVPFFEDIGLTVEFSSLEWAAFDPARDENQFSAYYLGLTGSTDPYSSPNQYMTSRGRTRGFYDTDPELEAVIWEGATIVDFDERQAFYQDVVYPATIDVAPWIFLWTPTTIAAIDNRIAYEQGGWPFVDVMKMSPAE